MTLKMPQGRGKAALLKMGFKLLDCPVIAYFFDPIAPKLIQKYLTRSFEKWKEEGKIQNYKIYTQRIGFLCYQINLRVFIEKKRTQTIILTAINNLVESVLQQVNKKIT